jgi:hypothetical protein
MRRKRGHPGTASQQFLLLFLNIATLKVPNNQIDTFVADGMLDDRRGPNCTAITPERRYYHTGHTFVKRSLRPTERQLSPMKGFVHIPRQGRERALNKAAAM